MAERTLDEVNRILATHKPAPMDTALTKEIDRIVKCAQHELEQH